MRNIFQTFFVICISISAILSQSLVYDSGLCYMRKVRQVCNCNHNSKKEIHTNQKSKSDCHDAKKTIHVCACKKHKNPNELSNLIKQIFFIVSDNCSLSIQFTKLFILFPNFLADLSGYQLTLIKPPRLS